MSLCIDLDGRDGGDTGASDLRALRQALQKVRAVQASVILQTGGGLRVCVVPAGDISPQALFEKIAEILAEFNIDADVAQISALPLTAEGGVDEVLLSTVEAIHPDVLEAVGTALRGFNFIDEESMLRPVSVGLPLPPLGELNGVGKYAASVLHEPDLPKAAASDGHAVFGASLVDQRWRTLNLRDMLDAAAQRRSAGLTYVADDGNEVFQSYADLRTAARRVAANLLARVPETVPATRVLVATRAAADVILLFWGCVYAGVTPILLTSSSAKGDCIHEQAAKVVEALRPDLAVIDPVHGDFRKAVEAAGMVRCITLEALSSEYAPVAFPQVDSASSAMLVLTSGSTGLPKGVPLSHSAILAKALGVAQMLGLKDGDAAVNWMPLDHVGGMVWLSILPICIGCSQVQVATSIAIEQPGLLLDLFERHRATFSWSSNFGLRIMIDEVARQPLRAWDLSAMRHIVNAGEPLNPTLISQFNEVMRRHLLSDGAVRPAFGMSETCSGITYGGAVFSDAVQSGRHISLGKPIPGAAIRIVSEDGTIPTDGGEGYLEVSGPSVFGGYYSENGLVRTGFDGPWFRTGDRAKTEAGELFVVGRSKNVVTINGAAVACEDIEAVVNELPAVLPSSSTVVARITSDGEAVSVVAVPRWTDCSSLIAFDRSIRAAVSSSFGFQPSDVLPISPDEIQRTSIGKIMRDSVRDLVLGGRLECRARWMLRLCQDRVAPAFVARRVWRQFPVRHAVYLPHRPVWLLLTAEDAAAFALANSLANAGADVATAHIAEDYARTGRRSFRRRSARANDVGRIVAALRAEGRMPSVMVQLLAAEPRYSATWSVAELMAEIEATMQAADAAGMRRCVFITRNGQAAGSGPVDRAQMALQGALQSAGRHSASIDVSVVDLPADSLADCDLIAAAMIDGAREKLVAVRNGVCLVPRLITEAALKPSSETRLRTGLYVVAGGLGGVGFLVARYLARTVNARLLLIGRTPSAAMDQRTLQLKLSELAEAGAADVHYLQADITDPGALQSAVNGALAEEGTRLAGVVHAACTLTEDATLLQDGVLKEDLDAGLRGTLALQALAREHDGAILIMLSSVSGMLGNPGYAAYAARSGFQQILAESETQGGTGTTWCISFSMIANTGVSSRYPFEDAVRSRGLRVLSPDGAIEGMAECLEHAPGHYLVGLETSHPAVRPMFDRLVHSVAQLVCYVVPAPDTSPPPLVRVVDERGRFADCRIVPLAELPRDSAGRLAIAASEDLDTLARAQPETVLERRIADCWAQILGLPSPSVDDNFFEQGGSSLLAIQLTAAIRDATGLAVRPTHIAQAATIRRLALLLESFAELPAVAGTVLPDEDFDATPAQAGIWAACQEHASTALYNTALGLSIDGPLNVERFIEAWRAIGQRHTCLRTRFEFDGTALRGRTCSEQRVFADTEDWRDRPQGKALDAAIRAFSREPFDLTVELPVRATLLRLGERRWLFVAVVHHIAFDDGSVAVLLDELGKLYSSLAPDELPPAYQFAKFAAAQAASGSTASLLLGSLAGSVPTTLRPDRPPPADRDVRGAAVTIAVSSEDAATLQALAGAYGASLFQATFAALVTLFYRQQCETDITLGCAVDRRPPEAAGRAVGLFVSVLPIRVTADPEAGFGNLLAAVCEAFATLEATGNASLASIARTFWPACALQRNGGLGIIVTENRGHAISLGQSCRSTWFQIHTDVAAADLTIVVTSTGGRLSVTFEFATDIFETRRVEGLASCLQTVIGSVARNPRAPLRTVPLLAPDQFDDVLKFCRGASTDHGTYRDFGALVKAALRRGGDRPAVTALGWDGSERTLTFAQFDQTAGAVARAVESATAPGALVGVHMHRCAELPAVAWGVMAAGRVYVPLDPDLPTSRLHTILSEAEPSLVISHNACEPRLEVSAPTSLLFVETLSDGGPTLSELRLSPPLDNAPAYVMFTSGSTGIPKGAVNSHGALANRIGWMQSEYQLTASDRVVLKTPISFDVSLWELIWPISAGARTVIVPPGAHRDPAALVKLIGCSAATVAHFVPCMLRAFLNEPEVGGAESLRLLVCSGEALDPQLQDRTSAVLSARLVNLYGPAEAAIDVTHWTCRPGDALVPIGTPIDNAAVYVLDEQHRPVPAGVAGEIWIGGLPVGLGYLRQPALTADRFQRDPFAPAGRMYKTGDRGVYQADGLLLYLGRADDQVKLAGTRIELGEVEAALRLQPNVEDAAAALQIGPGGAPFLAAFVVLKKGAFGETAARLRTKLRGLLPAAAVPHVEIVGSLPFTVNGKIDRRALSCLPEAQGSPEELEEEAPISLTLLLTSAIQKTLGLTEVQPEDDFYALGGDSLRLLSLVQHCRERGVSTSVRDWMNHPTAAAMAAHISASNWEKHLVPASFTDTQPSSDLSTVDSFALTSMQQLLTMLSRIDPRYRIYTTSLTLAGPLDVQQLEASIGFVIQLHPILRASVQHAPTGDRVIVRQDVRTPSLDIHDLRSVSVEQRRTDFKAWLMAEGRRSFDWRAAPLLRVTAHRLTDDTFRLTLSEPWLDGWSVATVARQVVETYDTLLSGGSLPWAKPDRVASTFARLETEAIADGAAARHWKAELRGACRVFGNGREPGEPTRLEVQLPPELGMALAAAASSRGLRLKHLLLGVHLRVVGLLAGTHEVVTGVMTHGRPEMPGSEAAVGFFITMTPLQANLQGATWLDLAHLAHRGELESHPFCRTPHTVIQEVLGGELPFDTLFNFTNFHVYRPLVAGQKVRLLDFTGSDQTYMPLTAQFTTDLQGELRLSLDLALPIGSTLEPETIAETYRFALEAAASGTELVASGAFLRGCRRAVQTPSSETIDERFEAVAESQSGVTALIHRDRAISFAEMASMVHVVAVRLLEHGVKPGNRVGLYFPDPSLVTVAMMAVLRVGAAFVPLPADQPEQRLRFIANDAALDLIAVPDPHAAAVALSLRDTLQVLRLDGIPASISSILPAARHDRGATAHILYTSGSTGTPKGVITSHASVMNRLAWMWRAYPFAADERLLLKTSLGFVDSIWELLGGLLAGCPTVVVTADLRDPGQIATVVRAFSVTRLTLIPSMMDALIEHSGSMPSLRLCVVSGEACSTRLAHRFIDRFGPARVLNLYGSTEVAGDATSYVVSGDERGAALPIGYPIDGTAVEVVNEAGEPVAPGVHGEIIVYGAAVCEGYLGRPELTATRFKGCGAQRRFHTGDLGWQDRTGCLHYAGRRDRQIKVSGMRIEPAEVETALEIIGARRAHVCMGERPGDDRPAMLLAFAEWVGRPPDSDVARRQLSKVLPRPMVPASVLSVTAIPLSANGKVDEDTLLREWRNTGSGKALKPEATVPDPLTETVRSAWSELLRVGQIADDDDFFALGGHSLLVVRLLNRLRRDLGLELPITTIFDEPAFSKFVKIVREADRAGMPNIDKRGLLS